MEKRICKCYIIGDLMLQLHHRRLNDSADSHTSLCHVILENAVLERTLRIPR